MSKMKKEQLEARFKIDVRGPTIRASLDFIYALYDAFEKGYKLPPREHAWRQDAPQLTGPRKVAYLYPPEYDIPSPNAKVAEEPAEAPEPVTEAPKPVSLEDELKAMTKKKDLLAKAEELGIEVPEDKKAPAAIRQHLINSLK